MPKGVYQRSVAHVSRLRQQMQEYHARIAANGGPSLATRAKMSHAVRGRSKSPETRIKMSLTRQEWYAQGGSVAHTQAMAKRSRRKQIACENCGVSIWRQPSQLRLRKRHFCSPACARAATPPLRGAAHGSWNGGPIAIACKQCGSEFLIRKSGLGRRRYCSRLCSALGRRVSGRSVMLRLHHSVARRIREQLQRQSISKAGRRVETLIGYSIHDLKRHLEHLFVPGMSWENYGSAWHIDHIRPRASFRFVSLKDPAFKSCWALTNLQPLWAEDNIRKSSTFTVTTCEEAA